MRRRWWSVGIVVAGVGLLAALNGAVLANGRTEPVTAADAILVLGAGVREGGVPSDVLRDRLDQALALYEAGRAPAILVSGDHHAPEYDETNTMRRYLEARGVSGQAIFMDHAGLDTYSSVWRAKHVFGVSRAIVVTQRFHLPRALFLARAVGLVAEGSACDRHVYRGAAWFSSREVASRVKAVWDVTVDRRPRFVGDPIPIQGGDGRVTADL